MAKKATKPADAPEVKTVRRKSIRESLKDGSNDVIQDVEVIIDKLKVLEMEAKTAGRPHRHFFAFQQRLRGFIMIFKKLLR